MPLYELVCVAKHYTSQYAPIQALLQQTASLVHQAGGCVRRLDSFGVRALPKRIRRDGENHEKADYWTMLFDTNPATLRELNERLRVDPRVLRWTTLKRGTTLQEVINEDAFRSKTVTQGDVTPYDVESLVKATTQLEQGIRPASLGMSRGDRERAAREKANQDHAR